VKVIGIIKNYGAPQGERPTIYLMADSSLLKDGKPFFIPDFAERFVAHPSLVVRINRLGKNISRKFAKRYYDAVTVGLCVKAEGVKEKFHDENPGALAVAFDGAAILGDFQEIGDSIDVNAIGYKLFVDGNEVAAARTQDMTLDIDGLIEYISKYFTLKIGDILFTGYNEAQIELKINSHIEGLLDGERRLDFKVK